MNPKNPPLKILIVEDEEAWQDDLQDAIHSFDPAAEIRAVYNSEAARALLDENKYDLAIVDLSLSGPANEPGSDTEGLELIKLIRQDPRNQNCVIVINTGYDKASVMRKAHLVLGADDYLVKVEEKDDFDEDLFVEMLKSALAQVENKDVGAAVEAFKAALVQAEDKDVEVSVETFKAALIQAENENDARQVETLVERLNAVLREAEKKTQANGFLIRSQAEPDQEARQKKEFEEEILRLARAAYKKPSGHEIINKFKQVLANPEEKFCVLSFTVAQNHLSYRFDGAYEAPEDEVHLKLSRERYNRQIAFFGRVIYRHHDLWLKTDPDGRERILREHQYEEGRNDWREHAEIMGQDFYQLLFDHALSEKRKDLHQHWGAARNAVQSKEENLVLRFNGPVENLALPFELLDDEKGPLALRHPMSRQINQTIATGRKSSWREFLNLRRDNHGSVRALLIATEKEAIPEIEKVAQQLEAFSQKINIQLQIDLPDRSSPLAIGQVREELAKKQHHLIHFVGHATFDEERPERSYLGTPKDIDEEHITAAELHDLLLGSPTQFLYLSCCSGAEMGKPDRGNTHWGLLHAAINAGVSASLGFRWWVRMESACRFAEAFYKNLDDSPFSLERAAFRAKKEIKNKDGWNETWFSPILVIQRPESAYSINT